MAGEWNEENWFDLADYADVDMDAGLDYEPSIDSSDGIAASGDLPKDPGDRATDGVEEGSLSPTTVRPCRRLRNLPSRTSSPGSTLLP